jgi:hypothetical protein
MLVNLRALLVRLIDIVLLRGGPELLPASPGLLGIVVVVNLAVSGFIYSFMPKAPHNWELQLLVETVVALLGLRVAFSLAHKPERFLQTSTAIFGTTTLFMPALIPMATALRPYLINTDPELVPPVALSLLAAILGIWLLVVQIRILRTAFEWHWLLAFIFFFALNFASALAYGMLFGMATEPV